MKVWVWMCRLMYSLLVASAVGFHVLKDTEPIWALASGAAGIFIITPLTISCVMTNNKRRRRKVAPAPRPQVEEHEDTPPHVAGVLVMIPAELAGEPKWCYDKQFSYVTQGVSAF